MTSKVNACYSYFWTPRVVEDHNRSVEQQLVLEKKQTLNSTSSWDTNTEKLKVFLYILSSDTKTLSSLASAV